MNSKKQIVLALACIGLLGASLLAYARLKADRTPAAEAAPAISIPGMAYGTPDLKSARALTFSPEGILFVGDSMNGAVFAVDVKDTAKDTEGKPVEIKEIDKKIASLLGITPDSVVITDMAVHPSSQNVYIAVSRGRGADATPVILRANKSGAIEEIALANVQFSKAALKDAPGPEEKTQRGASKRAMSITDIAFSEGQLFVSGLSNEEFASSVRRIPFPFKDDVASNTLEIFHTAHSKFETHAPIETFLPYKLKGQPQLLASYTCTPLAAFPLSELQSKKHVRGATLAELGGGNRPLDMIAYQKEGKDYILIANSNRTLISLAVEDLEKAQPLTAGVPVAYKSAGVGYLSIAQVGVLQLDNLNPGYVVVIQRDTETGTLNLRSLPKRWV